MDNEAICDLKCVNVKSSLIFCEKISLHANKVESDIRVVSFA